MKKALNQKARRVINRVRKILIANEKQHTYFLQINFNKKTYENTSETTRHKYILKALTSLKCDYIASKNYNKEKTKEHYSAIISTNYSEFLNHLTYKWLSTKGTLRHELIKKEQRIPYNVRKFTIKLCEIHKNELNLIADKNIIYSDINKTSPINELQYKIKLNRDKIIYYKSKNKDVKELYNERDKLINELKNEKNKSLKEIAQLFNTSKGKHSEIEIIETIDKYTAKTSEQKQAKELNKPNYSYLKYLENNNRLINKQEYLKLKKENNPLNRDVILFYEIEHNLIKTDNPSLKRYIENKKNFLNQIKEFNKSGLTTEQFINYCKRAKKGADFYNEKGAFQKIEQFCYMKPYTAQIEQEKLKIENIIYLIQNNFNINIDKKLGL